MKNSKKKISLAVALLLLLGSAYYLNRSSIPDLPKLEKMVIAKDNIDISSDKIKYNIKDKIKEKDILVKSEKLTSFNNFSLSEKKSLIILSSFLNDASKGDLPMETLVEELKDLKIKPLVMKDYNEYTGGLNIVRTRDALPGTRYIHAQYFEGENSSALLQHLSFEFKGGENAFGLVKKVIQEQLKISTLPTQQSESFISWKIGKKIVWIKKLDLQDISKDNPFNSYDLKHDIGTIRVTIELEIH